jgi:hypothetical protein
LWLTRVYYYDDDKKKTAVKEGKGKGRRESESGETRWIRKVDG